MLLVGFEFHGWLVYVHRHTISDRILIIGMDFPCAHAIFSLLPFYYYYFHLYMCVFTCILQLSLSILMEWFKILFNNFFHINRIYMLHIFLLLFIFYVLFHQKSFSYFHIISIVDMDAHTSLTLAQQQSRGSK